VSNGEFALEEYVFGLPGERRFTQDSPVLPEVWVRFAEDPEGRQDLLLVPHKNSSAAVLVAALRERLGVDGARELAYNEGYVVARLDFHQLVRDVIPLSPWWRRLWPPRVRHLDSWLRSSDRSLEELLGKAGAGGFRPDWLAWFAALLGGIELGDRAAGDEASAADRWRRLASAGAGLLAELPRPAGKEPAPLWSVAANRAARTALSRSRLAVKADAAQRVFAIGCADVRWAIVDTGIDATHPAFRRRNHKGALIPLGEGKAFEAATRVVATYDFTRLRPIVSGQLGALGRTERKEIEHRLNLGRALDWDALKPLLAVSHDADYRPPSKDHGTHVAGIVGADWRLADGAEMPAEDDLIGICPDIQLYDLRVFDERGEGDEFSVSAALQFVRHLNSHSDLQVIHGVNLSLSLDHDLANYAVGRTPICDECERLTGSGVVVAVAAGNEGQARYAGREGRQSDGFRTVAITDPGNAESVITVGSTHRQDPHTYGVSYFSSRGPTGDGRCKPDLVAPGEKIKSPVPGGKFQVKDGTSQATAHVSGVAAMLMARNRELTAQPRRVKEILCGTATDLGRERYFQGAGLIDALRALQEV
jgi:serine protease AprX